MSSLQFYINEPVVTMRENPTHDSKVVSQAILSEKVTVEKNQEGWVHIKTPDDYLGWVPADSFVKREGVYETTLKISRKAAHLYGVKDTEYAPIKTLAYGSKLQSLDASDSRWIKIAMPDGKECYIQKGDVAPEKELRNKGDLAEFSKNFLGLPYTWGGRSSFGYDCSGFVQMLYNRINISLQRDSRLQILDERFKTVSSDAIESGDLIFFGRALDKITHVGMSIGNGEFIHAVAIENQPWIRISKLLDTEWNGKLENRPCRIVRQLIT